MRPRIKDRHLPPCVYLRGATYYLVKKGSWKRLGGERELEAYKASLNHDLGPMVALIRTALAAIKAKPKDKGGIADATKEQYEVAARKLEYAFKDFEPAAVRGKHINALKRGMADTPNMFNRCLSLLRQIFDFALDEEIIEDNPAMGVKRLQEAARERLITKPEFDLLRSHAAPRFQCMMDIWYHTGQRVMDVARIRLSDLGQEGVYFKQRKTGARLVVQWTPELRDAVERAKTLNTVRSLTLFSTTKGKNRGGSPAYGTVRDQWRTACKRAGIADAQIRDLRAMSATAVDEQGGNAQAILGHTTPTNTRRYLRSKKVPQVQGPSFVPIPFPILPKVGK